MAYKYALPGPPFNFLGNFSETQRDNLKAWVNARKSKFAAIQLHHQIRAQQLRKTAGVLEQFYANTNDQKLTPTFQKEAWQPGPYGHFNYAYRDDHIPMVTVAKLKTAMQAQFQRDDEGVFYMNLVRTIIEKHEDAAQYANDAVSSTAVNNVTQLLSDIDGLFAKNEYQAVLVKDQTDQYGSGAAAGPRFRVHQFDFPTQWELERMNHSSPQTPIQIKEAQDAVV
jgi:hypothetical protein